MRTLIAFPSVNHLIKKNTETATKNPTHTSRRRIPENIIALGSNATTVMATNIVISLT